MAGAARYDAPASTHRVKGHAICARDTKGARRMAASTSAPLFPKAQNKI